MEEVVMTQERPMGTVRGLWRRADLGTREAG